MLIHDILSTSGVITSIGSSSFAFNAKDLAIATVIVAVLGLLIGLFLGAASKKLEVPVDEKEAQVRDLLPGANCGGCGYAGCDACAKAIAEGKAPVNVCPVASSEEHAKIATVMGGSLEETEKQVAYVKCAGTCDKTKIKSVYYGAQSCKVAAMTPGNGNKQCSYGCMGFGDCVKVCAFDAIHIVDGIAVVDKEKCTGCTMCTAECPNKLIDMVPEKARHLVTCSSKDKGKDVKAGCSIGCIGCKLCQKNCEFDAITVTDNLALIDYSKCTNCGKCAQVCPVKVIEVKPA